MSFSQFAATRFVPLLGRIVLCMAFVPAGWNKIMDTSTFEGPAADRLVALGVVGGVGTVPMESAQPASEDAGEGAGGTPTRDEEGGGVGVAGKIAEPIRKAVEDLADVPQDAMRSLPGGSSVVEAKRLHHVTLMIDEAGFGPYAVVLAWTAALTEFVGGGLILLGLMSRIWGLGLAIAMGVAFYLTSLGPLMDTMVFGMDVPAFNRMFCQLGLFVLSFGVFLTGPGAMSMDGALFGRGAANPAPAPAPATRREPPPSPPPSSRPPAVS